MLGAFWFVTTDNTSHHNHHRHRHRHWGYHGTSCLSQYIQPGPECNSWPLFICILYGPILMISDISSCSIKTQYENYTKFRISLQQQWAFELLKLRDIRNLLIFCFLFMLHSTTVSECVLLRISWTFAQLYLVLHWNAQNVRNHPWQRGDLFLTFFKKIKTCKMFVVFFLLLLLLLDCSRIYAIKFFSADPSKTSAILLTYSVCGTHKR